MAGQTPKTVLDKLLKCQQIIGYNFRDISLLQESLTTGKNRRLATAGDTYVQVALVDRWYSIEKSTSFEFNTVRMETVSNENLAKVGYRRGLHACTLPYALSPYSSNSKGMADTIEALLGAVYRDALFDNGKRNAEAANWEAFEGVIARLGLNHHLIASESDLRWSLAPMKTTRTLMRQFFSGGHHLALAKLVADTSSKLTPLKLDASPRDMPASVPGVKRPKGEGRTIAPKAVSDARSHPQDVQSDEKIKKEQASTNKETDKMFNVPEPKPQASERKPGKKSRPSKATRLKARRLTEQWSAKKKKRKATRPAK